MDISAHTRCAVPGSTHWKTEKRHKDTCTFPLTPDFHQTIAGQLSKEHGWLCRSDVCRECTLVPSVLTTSKHMSGNTFSVQSRTPNMYLCPVHMPLRVQHNTLPFMSGPVSCLSNSDTFVLQTANDAGVILLKSPAKETWSSGFAHCTTMSTRVWESQISTAALFDRDGKNWTAMSSRLAAYTAKDHRMTASSHGHEQVGPHCKFQSSSPRAPPP